MQDDTSKLDSIGFLEYIFIYLMNSSNDSVCKACGQDLPVVLSIFEPLDQKSEHIL